MALQKIQASLPRLWPRKLPHVSWDAVEASERKKIVVLGCGWGSFSFCWKVDRKLYDVVVVSPRNHFLFTPLLTSTTVGTLEYRCITEPIRSLKSIVYHQGRAMDIDTNRQIVTVRDSFETDHFYQLSYDALIYGVGARANDFGISGVKSHAYFLKQIRDAMAIRDRIQELFERAMTPGVSRAEKEKLLSIVIVGGGPTSIEFAAELHDWLMEDGVQMFPELLDLVSITLVEASNRLLAGFDRGLADYTLTTFRKRKIKVILSSHVTNVSDDFVELSDGYKLQFGMVVWATGNAPVPLTDKMQWHKTRTGRISVDEFLRVPTTHNVFAVGDCAEYPNKALAPTAQVAKQHGYYLSSVFNELLTFPQSQWEQQLTDVKRSFAYSHRGMMAYVGGWKGVVALGNSQKEEMSDFRRRLRGRLAKLTGIKAWLFWRSAYFTMLRSIPNQILVPMFWFKTWIFGRDFSRF